MTINKQGFIYRNIYLYRTIMFLYTFGRYTNDYKTIFSLIPPKSRSVLELCFGDIYIAKLCKKSNISWTGYDVSDYFVDHAKKNHFNAIAANLNNVKFNSQFDVAIISRSLYQFKNNLSSFFDSIFQSTSRIIICESIKTLADTKIKTLHWISKVITHSGISEHVFRYNQNSIQKDIDLLSQRFDLIVKKKIIKNNNIFYLIEKNNINR